MYTSADAFVFQRIVLARVHNGTFDSRKSLELDKVRVRLGSIGGAEVCTQPRLWRLIEALSQRAVAGVYTRHTEPCMKVHSCSCRVFVSMIRNLGTSGRILAENDWSVTPLYGFPR